MKRHVHLVALAIFAVAVVLSPRLAQETRAQGPLPQSPEAALGTGFTYQGELKKNGVPLNGTCNMTFSIWDSLSNLTGQIGSSEAINNIVVTNGRFTAVLNSGGAFGANAYKAEARWLQTAVQCLGDVSPVTLTRMPITAVPQAQFAAAPWGTLGSAVYYLGGNVGIGTAAPTSRLEIYAQDGLAITGFQPFLTLRDTNTARRSIVAAGDGDFGFYPNSFIGGSPAVVLKNLSGNVGIGTTAPSALLSVVKAGAPEPSVQGVPAGLKVGAPSGTIPLALKQNAAEGTNPGIAYFETNSGDLGYLGANSGAFVVGATAGKALALDTNGSTRAMTIASNGAVGIGTTNLTATLHIHSPGTTIASNGLAVENGIGVIALRVDDSAGVHVNLAGFSASHVCFWDWGGAGLLSQCQSAAEYVPTIDGGQGFPETADLVSMVPDMANPYDDPHGPFTVQKSVTACDPNLLGFVLDPQKGADGKKLNDHYLPLAIFGYFPAKITVQNGAIRRGDPLTSSSKAGYGMKATGACKIIGYALEDATEDGTIQVFAHLSENAAPGVAVLRAEMEALKQQNAALAARLDALEKK